MSNRHSVSLAVSIAIIGVLVIVTAPHAVAESCPEGKFSITSPDTRQVTCVSPDSDGGGSSEVGKKIKGKESRTAGSEDRWKKPGLPDNYSGVRKESDLPKDKSQWTWDEDRYYSETDGECWGIDDLAAYLRCQNPWVTPLERDDGSPPPTTISPEEAAQQVIATLEFSAAAPQIGPNRDHHDFPFDSAVGYPLWLWTSGGTTDNSVIESVGSLTVEISIRLERVDWNLGDGTTLRCDKGTEWRRGTVPGRKSPTCGHVYEQPGKYTIEATSKWTIAWTAGGQSGTMPYSITTERPFEVGEIHVLVR